MIPRLTWRHALFVLLLALTAAEVRGRVAEEADCVLAHMQTTCKGEMEDQWLAPRRSAGWRRARRTTGPLIDHLSGTRVAVLLIGDAFRSRHGGESRCNVNSTTAQREASLSYVERVIEPLEALGANVDVIFTFPRCESHALDTTLCTQLT